MARLLLPLIALTGILCGQQAPPTVQDPPEEDVALIEQKTYTFNPLQAEKEVTVGLFYMKKSNFKAARLRFLEATKWNPSLAPAWLHLGEAMEKYKDMKAAKAAYAKYLELAPDAKNAAAVKKKL